MTSEQQQEIREYWDEDAATYDASASHSPRSIAELAAWSAALARLLPPSPRGCSTSAPAPGS